MRNRWNVVVPSLMAVWLGFAREAQAGMPSITLSDMARERIQTISFFLASFLICGWVLQWIWNGLRHDFPRLPRLSYGKAVGVMTLWGLLFLLVLTMISGARELMTPGAWRKEGFTYKLESTPRPPPSPPADLEALRRQKLESLALLLWHYANQHEGRFPPDDKASEIPGDAWILPDPSGMRYRYIKGNQVGSEDWPLVVEPAIFGSERLVLFTSREIRLLSSEKIRNLLEERKLLAK